MTPDEIAELRRVVSVKPLEWRVLGDVEFSAWTPDFSARYRVHQNGDDWYLDQDYMGKGGKVAAQAHYEQSILSALTLASRALPDAPDAGGDARAAFAGFSDRNGIMSQDDLRDMEDEAIRIATRLCGQAKREAYAECLKAAREADHGTYAAEAIEALAEKKP